MLFLTDGEEPISGLGFDLEIEQEISKTRREAARTKRPILIALSAIDGQVVGWRVKIGADRDLPRLPERPKPAPAPVISKTEPETVAPPLPKEPEPETPVVLNLPPGAKLVPVAAPVSEPVNISHFEASQPAAPKRTDLEVVTNAPPAPAPAPIAASP